MSGHSCAGKPVSVSLENDSLDRFFRSIPGIALKRKEAGSEDPAFEVFAQPAQGAPASYSRGEQLTAPKREGGGTRSVPTAEALYAP